MRRLWTKEDIERRNKTRTIILSGTMLLLLVLSTLGFAFLSNTGSNKENDEDIPNNFSRISFQYQNNQIALLSTYNEIGNVSVEISSFPYDYTGNILYINSDNKGIFQEIAYTLGRFSSRVQEACYGNCSENLPEKNCSDNLIIWRESTINKVYQNESCVFIEGDIRAADAFVYKLFNP